MISFLSSHKAALYSVLSTFIRVFTGPLSIYLISERLSVEQQAVYYVFLSISAIQWIFEMGLTTCLVQRVVSTDKLETKYRSICFGFYFFIVSSMIMLVSLNIFSGWVFDNIVGDFWRHPWLLYSLAVSFTLIVNSIYICEEGIGNPIALFKAKFISGLIYAFSLICSLLFGAGLYSLAIAQLLMVLISFSLLKKNIKIICFSLKETTLVEVRDELIAILPFQFKLMIVWFVGYFYWNFYSIYFVKYTDILFSSRYGATNAILSAITFSCMAFLQTKRAYIGCMISKKVNTHAIFKNSLYIALFLYFIGASALMLIISNSFVIDGSRFLAGSILLSLIVLRLIAMCMELLFIYLRCFNDEPLYKLTIILYLLSPLFILFSSGDYIFVPSIFFMSIMSIVMFFKGKEYLNDKYKKCN